MAFALHEGGPIRREPLPVRLGTTKRRLVRDRGTRHTLLMPVIRQTEDRSGWSRRADRLRLSAGNVAIDSIRGRTVVSLDRPFETTT